MTQTIEQPPAAPSSNGGAIQRVSAYNPLAPISTPGALKGLLEAQSKSIAQALPRHITPERLIKTMLVAVNRIPDLLQCTQASLVETINRAAELGLDLSGTLGEAYPVPFNNKVKTAQGEQWLKQCQLIIGYRGFVKLARQSGEIKRIDADVVCRNDHFVLRKGTGAKCEFVPNLGDRGDPIGAYAYVEFKDGGEQFDFMPCEDIDKVRRRSKSGSDRDGNAIGAWRTDWGEMAKKTVFRRVAKWLPLSTEKFVSALEQDDSELNLHDVIEVETAPQTDKAQAMADRARKSTQVRTPSTSPAPQPVAESAEQSGTAIENPPSSQAAGGDGGSAAEDQWRGAPSGEESQAKPGKSEATNIQLREAIGGDWAEATKVLFDATDGVIAADVFSKALGKWAMGLQKKGKESSISFETRKKLYLAIKAGKFNFETGKISD